MKQYLQKAFPKLPERLSGLGELAYNLWWSWHPEARMLFKMIDRQIWKESVHNPVKVLKQLPKETFGKLVSDTGYLRYYDAIIARFRGYMDTKGDWFLENLQTTAPLPIVYFSAEYGLHRSLPFYAGGLGFLAGDHIKECSDLGIPIIAIGFMYPKGYVRQKIRDDGWQEGTDQPVDREMSPIIKVMGKSGKQLVVKVPLLEPAIYVAVWKVLVGRVILYLMDTDIDLNEPWNKAISARLYMGDLEQRLRQEIILGMGGYQVLSALEIEHSGIHLNEGHPAFAILEEIREITGEGVSLEKAIHKIKSTYIFTTHTPVPAGHDVFPFPLIEKYLSSYWDSLGMTREAFLQMGISPENPGAGFNMTAFALKMCNQRNAVSKRHGEVTRRMWHGLWQEVSENQVPIDHITNGVHVPTWLEPKLMFLFNKYLGSDWIEHHDDPSIWELVEDIPDDELWETHLRLKSKLINFIRERVRKRRVEDRINPSIIMSEGVMLDPSVLTIGFARRFATYKRANLLFHDIDRLIKILNQPWRPVQIIFAGKAHPADTPGKRVLQEVFNAAGDPAIAGRIAFIEDYGEQLAQYMVHGVDVWLNNPIPPMEASGTSGMKAALNGVPHLSIMDGWWVEGFNGKNGWIFGKDEQSGDRDKADAEALYDLLENEIIPLYYRTLVNGLPKEWINLMKQSIKSNGPRFSARRMVKEYVKKFILKRGTRNPKMKL